MSEETAVAQAVEEKLDLENASFLETEEIVVDTETDQFGFPAPPPDGTYTAILSMDEEYGFKKKIVGSGNNKGKEYGQMIVKVKFVGGEYDGFECRDYINSLVSRDQTSRAAGILIALGQNVAGKQTPKSLLIMLRDALAIQPTTTVTGRWEAFIKDTQKRVRGMKNFKPKTDEKGQVVAGEFLHDYVDNDGHEIKANFNITRYAPAA